MAPEINYAPERQPVTEPIPGQTLAELSNKLNIKDRMTVEEFISKPDVKDPKKPFPDYGKIRNTFPGITSEDVRDIALLRMEKQKKVIITESQDKIASLKKGVQTGVPATTTQPVAPTARIDAKKPVQTVESFTNYEDKIAHITKMAESVNSSMEIVPDHPNLIKTMLPMGLLDNDFLPHKTKNAVLQALKNGEKNITGIKQANYSYEILIKAANDPTNHTAEFKSFLAKMVSSGKIQENPNKSPKYSTIEKWSVILKMTENGSDSKEKNIGFMRHELRHAIIANLGLRSNIDFLKKAEIIIQKQSPDWKKNTLKFFIGTPYIDRLLSEDDKKTYVSLDKTDDTRKTTFVNKYFEKNKDNFLISNTGADRAVALDEFIAYATDKSPSGPVDIPEMKELLKWEIEKAKKDSSKKWTDEQFQVLIKELE
jgi:hypothetical protein